MLSLSLSLYKRTTRTKIKITNNTDVRLFLRNTVTIVKGDSCRTENRAVQFNLGTCGYT